MRRPGATCLSPVPLGWLRHSVWMCYIIAYYYYKGLGRWGRGFLKNRTGSRCETVPAITAGSEGQCLNLAGWLRKCSYPLGSSITLLVRAFHGILKSCTISLWTAVTMRFNTHSSYGLVCLFYRFIINNWNNYLTISITRFPLLHLSSTWRHLPCSDFDNPFVLHHCPMFALIFSVKHRNYNIRKYIFPMSRKQKINSPW